MKYKVRKGTLASEKVGEFKVNSDVIVYGNKTLEKVLDKLNGAFGLYENLSETPANKMSEVLVGNSTQDGTPTPDNPVEIKSVTGAKKLNVVVGEETKTFDLDLGDIELNGIDAYRDKIDLVDDKWNIVRQVQTEKYSDTSMLTINKYAVLDNSIYFSGKGIKSKTEKCYCNYLPFKSASDLWQKDNQGVSTDKSNAGNPRARISKTIATNANEFDLWLKSHTLIIKWIPDEIKNEEITDTNLISQLNTIINYLISLELKGQTYTLSLEDVNS